MQREINHLKRSLAHEQQKRAPSNSDFSSGAKRMIAIGTGRELHLVSPYMIRIIIMSAGIESCLRSDWEMMMRVKHSTRFLGHLSHVGSKKGDFLNGFLNPCSPCKMDGQILWSMLATSIKECSYTLKTSL